jgi:predicted transcriptional regulator
MNVMEIAELLKADTTYLSSALDKEYEHVFASDMMSDVLAYAMHGTILITGLCNLQIVRTAEMVDSDCIILVRGKKPSDEMLEMAKEADIHFLVTPYSLYDTCGKLYLTGKLGGTKIVK